MCTLLARDCDLIAMLVLIQIVKEHVDSCGTGQEFPHCELTAEWTKRDHLLSRTVSLIGAKEPYNYFLILLDISDEDSLRMVLNCISTLAAEWFNLGVALGLFYPTLNITTQEMHTDV